MKVIALSLLIILSISKAQAADVRIQCYTSAQPKLLMSFTKTSNQPAILKVSDVGIPSQPQEVFSFTENDPRGTVESFEYKNNNPAVRTFRFYAGIHNTVIKIDSDSMIFGGKLQSIDGSQRQWNGKLYVENGSATPGQTLDITCTDSDI